MIRRYKTRVAMNDPKVKGIQLDDVARVTEAVDQPDPDEADSSAVTFAGSSFVTRFDLIMKDGSTRSFICFTPEDSRSVPAVYGLVLVYVLVSVCVPAGAGHAVPWAGGPFPTTPVCCGQCEPSDGAQTGGPTRWPRRSPAPSSQACRGGACLHGAFFLPPRAARLLSPAA